jgi:predicted ester cyclase
MRSARRPAILMVMNETSQEDPHMQPKDVVRRFVEEYQSAANEAALDELMHPDVVDHSRPPGVAPGAEGVRQQFDGFRAAFPDFRATILDQVAEDDRVVTRKVFHGTHLGPFQGIAPTGREVEIHLIDIVRVTDGQIVEHWNCVDRLGLLAQLGVLPEAMAGAPS